MKKVLFFPKRLDDNMPVLVQVTVWHQRDYQFNPIGFYLSEVTIKYIVTRLEIIDTYHLVQISFQGVEMKLSG